MATTWPLREPYKPISRAALVAAPLKEADDITATGRGRDPLQAYRAIVAKYPGTPEAKKAEANAAILANQGQRTLTS